MTIEFARPEHYEAVCAVIAEVDAAHEEQLPDVFCKRSGPIRPRDFLVQRMQGPESVILVALEDAAVVGVLEVLMKPAPARDGLVPRRVALIDNVVVRVGYRGRGIGSKLLARAETWAIEQGAAAIELNVWSTNTSAKGLYESLGYVTRLVRMERSLEGKPSPGEQVKA